jgi:hypothetical protein
MLTRVIRARKEHRNTETPWRNEMHKLEPLLSINGRAALEMVRAIRELPDFEGTYRAERSALKNININDLKYIAVILKDEEEARRG